MTGKYFIEITSHVKALVYEKVTGRKVGRLMIITPYGRGESS